MRTYDLASMCKTASAAFTQQAEAMGYAGKVHVHENLVTQYIEEALQEIGDALYEALDATPNPLYIELALGRVATPNVHPQDPIETG